MLILKLHKSIAFVQRIAACSPGVTTVSYSRATVDGNMNLNYIPKCFKSLSKYSLCDPILTTSLENKISFVVKEILP